MTWKRRQDEIFTYFLTTKKASVPSAAEATAAQPVAISAMAQAGSDELSDSPASK